MNYAKKHWGINLFAILLVICTVIGGGAPESVQAGSYYKEGALIYTVATRDVKSAVSAEILASIIDSPDDYVEIVVKSGATVMSRSWFEKSTANWTVSLPEAIGAEYSFEVYTASTNTDCRETVEKPLATIAFEHAEIEGSILATTDVSVEGQSVTAAFYDIRASHAISNVKFIFRNEAGNDVYYAFGAADGTGKYTARVEAKKFNPAFGKYNVTAEVTDENGAVVAIDKAADFQLVGAFANVGVADVDKSTGTFSVNIPGLYAISGVKEVNVVVWGKDENVDSHAYTAKKAKDGSYSCQVDIANHGYFSGMYTVRVDAKLKDGKVFEAATTECRLDTYNFVVFNDTDRYTFEKEVEVYNPTNTKDMYLSVSSQKSKGADKEYYKAEYKDGKLSFVVKMNKLKDSGKIDFMLCQKKNDKYSVTNKWVYKADTYEVQKDGWYYEKAKNKKYYKFYYKKGKKKYNMTKALKLKKEKMYIEVNRLKNRVTVFAYDKETKSYCIPVISFKCSVGVASMATPTGTFNTDRNHRWKELMGPSWGQYATHIVGGIYFHSIAGSTTDSYGISAYAYNKLGTPASHGCIRLTVRDAKWIYDHCAIGTKVKIFDAKYAGPLKTQYVPKIKASQHYDPTDPAVK